MTSPGQAQDPTPPAGSASTERRGVNRRRMLAISGTAAVAGAAVATGGTRLLTRDTNTSGSVASTAPASSGAAAPTLAYTESGVGVPAVSTIAADASPEFRSMCEALQQAMLKKPVPGAALGMVSGDREEYAYFGIESVNTNVVVGPGTLFQLGSMTKTHTATAIWRLIDEGKLKLDGRVRDYLPDLRLADERTAAALTVGNLLDHTGGFFGGEGSYNGEDDQAITRFVRDRLPTFPQLSPLGQFPSYSNSGFVLLGRLIEVATGRPYHAALQDLLLGPLQLNDTMLEASAVLGRPHVDGHYVGPIGDETVRVAVQTPLFVPRAIAPAGGLWGTPRDVLAYARFHSSLGRSGAGAGAVSADSLRQMQEPVKAWPGLDLSIGRNWFVQDAGGVRAICHNGDVVGSHAMLVIVPDKQLAVTMLINTGGAASFERAVLNAFTGSHRGLEVYTNTLGMIQPVLAPADTPTVTPTAAELAAYVGTYSDPNGTSTITAGGPDGAPLAMTLADAQQQTDNAYLPVVQGSSGGGGPSPITLTGQDRGLVNGVERMMFLRDDAGRVGWMAKSLRLSPHT